MYEHGRVPLILAHRGGAGECPENSRVAFKAALAAGFRHIETDVRATKDGVAVIFHDATLDRTTDGTGPIAEYTWRELSKVRDVSGGRLMRAEEAFEEFGGAVFNVDIKCDDAAEPLFRAIRRADAWKRVCIASFSQRRIRQARRELPGVATSLAVPAVAGFVGVGRLPARLRGLAGRVLPRGTVAIQALQVPVRRRGVRIIDAGFVELAHARGLAVHAWTINDGAEAERLLALGVDGIITDVPSALRDRFDGRGIAFRL